MAEKKTSDEQSHLNEKPKRTASGSHVEHNEPNTSNQVSEIIRELINNERIARQGRVEYVSSDEDLDFLSDSSGDGVDEDRVINIDKKKNIMEAIRRCADDIAPEHTRPRQAKRRSKSKRRKGRSRSRSRRRSKRR